MNLHTEDVSDVSELAEYPSNKIIVVADAVVFAYEYQPLVHLVDHAFKLAELDRQRGSFCKIIILILIVLLFVELLIYQHRDGFVPVLDRIYLLYHDP